MIHFPFQSLASSQSPLCLSLSFPCFLQFLPVCPSGPKSVVSAHCLFIFSRVRVEKKLGEVSEGRRINFSTPEWSRQWPRSLGSSGFMISVLGPPGWVSRTVRRNTGHAVLDSPYLLLHFPHCDFCHLAMNLAKPDLQVK